MPFEDSRIGFSSQPKKKNLCKTFETSTPPKFEGDFVMFEDERVGKMQVEKKNVTAFRQAGSKWKIKVCKK